MSDEIDFCRIFFRAAVDGDKDAILIRCNVCVGENLIFTNNESGSNAATKLTGVPRSLVIGIDRIHSDPNNGSIDGRVIRRLVLCFKKLETDCRENENGNKTNHVGE